ncbi:MAG: GGDEF domain-containing protein [Candidatus Omnitrophota bacterium]
MIKIFSYYILIVFVLFLSYRLSLTKAIAVSIGASIFLIIKDIKALDPDLFMVILFVNTMPFIAKSFETYINKERDILKSDFDKMKNRYEGSEQNDQSIMRSNIDKDKRLQRLLSLYEVSKDMSTCLYFEEVFRIFQSAMKRFFRFRSSRFIFFDDTYNIHAIYEINIGKDTVKSNLDNFDREIMDTMAKDKKIISLSGSVDTHLFRRLSIIKDYETLYSFPLFVEKNLRGIFYIENLPDIYYENFTILMSQFAIQFQKVMLYRKVEELSITDSLTGVSTRRYFLERFEEEIHRSMRHKSNISLLMLDIDHFKGINDKYGHLVGDVVLKEVAGVLKASLREIDIIGRYGGEEFIVALSGTSKDIAFQVAERIRENVQCAIVKAYDEVVSVAISIGISIFPDDGVNLNELIESADRALYKAKESGRNKVC